MHIEIRRLEESDSIELLTDLLHRAYSRLGEMGLNYTAVDQTTGKTRERIKDSACYVAIIDSKIVGTITARPTDALSACVYFKHAHVASAHQFAVTPELQGSGIGRMLIQRAEHWATEKGFAELALDTAEPASHLVEFYGRLGYSKVDEVQWAGKKYRSIVMSKRLVL